MLFIVVASLNRKQDYDRISSSLVATQLVMTLYCLLQIMHRDPIKWSAYWTFGTLGNVNFLSGFMGIASVNSLVLAFGRKYSLPVNLVLIAMSLTDIWIVVTTDSIQGLIALAVGIAVFVQISLLRGRKVWLLTSLGIFALSFLGLVLALFDKGPLKSLIYQVTIIYRADYMHAAVKMLIHNPLTGVGIDSYDDWYRYERGIISAFRTGFGRTANTAHNVILDLGAGGGFPLMITYLALLVFIAWQAIRGISNGLHKEAVFVALVSSWVAYQVQAAVSINQIGVGVWGWILGGAIVGYSRMSRQSTRDGFPDQNLRAKSKSEKLGRRIAIPNSPPPASVLTSVALFSLGFTFAYIPLKTDMDFRDAFSKGKLDLMMKATSGFAANSFLIAQTNEAAMRNNFPEQARSLSEKLTSKFPRYLYGWQVRLGMNSLSEAERNSTIERIRSLDPYLGMCADADATGEIKRLLLTLPSTKQFELARGWGILDPGAKVESFSLISLDATTLDTRIRTFCTG